MDPSRKITIRYPTLKTGILTIGDNKYLHFQMYEVDELNNHIPVPNKNLWFHLRHGDEFVLDPNDEIPKKRGEKAFKTTYWKHEAELVDKEIGISMAAFFVWVTMILLLTLTMTLFGHPLFGRITSGKKNLMQL